MLNTIISLPSNIAAPDDVSKFDYMENKRLYNEKGYRCSRMSLK